MSKIKVFAAFLISFIIYMFFWENILLTPLRIFLTAIHEAFHGIATILTGGNIYKMSLNHLSGVLVSSGGIYPLISISGYLGSALLGSLLISSNKKSIYLITISIIVFLISLFYIDKYFSYEFILLNIMIFILFFLIFKKFYLKEISLFLGTLLAMESIQDIRMYLFVAPEKTDSGLLAHYIGLDILALPISIFLFIVSIIIWFKIGLKRVLNEKSL